MNRSVGRSKANPIKIDAVMNANQHFFSATSNVMFNHQLHGQHSSGIVTKRFFRVVLFARWCHIGKHFTHESASHLNTLSRELTNTSFQLWLVKNVSTKDYRAGKTLRHMTFFNVNCLFSLRVVIEKSCLFLFSFQQFFLICFDTKHEYMRNYFPNFPIFNQSMPPE